MMTTIVFYLVSVQIQFVPISGSNFGCKMLCGDRWHTGLFLSFTRTLHSDQRGGCLLRHMRRQLRATTVVTSALPCDLHRGLASTYNITVNRSVVRHQQPISTQEGHADMK